MPRGPIEILAPLLHRASVAQRWRDPLRGNAHHALLIVFGAPCCASLNRHHPLDRLIEIFLLHRQAHAACREQGRFVNQGLARSRPQRPLVACGDAIENRSLGQLHLLGIDI